MPVAGFHDALARCKHLHLGLANITQILLFHSDASVEWEYSVSKQDKQIIWLYYSIHHYPHGTHFSNFIDTVIIFI